MAEENAPKAEIKYVETRPGIRQVIEPLLTDDELDAGIRILAYVLPPHDRDFLLEKILPSKTSKPQS